MNLVPPTEPNVDHLIHLDGEVDPICFTMNSHQPLTSAVIDHHSPSLTIATSTHHNLEPLPFFQPVCLIVGGLPLVWRNAGNLCQLDGSGHCPSCAFLHSALFLHGQSRFYITVYRAIYPLFALCQYFGCLETKGLWVIYFGDRSPPHECV